MLLLLLPPTCSTYSAGPSAPSPSYSTYSTYSTYSLFYLFYLFYLFAILPVLPIRYSTLFAILPILPIPFATYSTYFTYPSYSTYSLFDLFAFLPILPILPATTYLPILQGLLRHLLPETTPHCRHTVETNYTKLMLETCLPKSLNPKMYYDVAKLHVTLHYINKNTSIINASRKLKVQRHLQIHDTHDNNMNIQQPNNMFTNGSQVTYKQDYVIQKWLCSNAMLSKSVIQKCYDPTSICTTVTHLQDYVIPKWLCSKIQMLCYVPKSVNPRIMLSKRV